MEGVAALSGAEIRMLAEKHPIHDDKGRARADDDGLGLPEPPWPNDGQAWSPADQPFVGYLEKGDQVHYWSETHNCWIWTRVEEPSYDQASGVELAIKQNANRGKIRAEWKWVTDADGSRGNWEQKRPLRHDARGDPVAKQDSAEDLAGQRKASADWFPQEGEMVQYWSPTFGKYIQAKVQAINAPNGDGDYTLDLNVKKRAPIASVWPLTAGLPAPPAEHQPAPPAEHTPRQRVADVPDRSQTPLRAPARGREDRSVRASRTYVRSTTAAPNSSRNRGGAEEQHVLRSTMEPGHVGRRSAERDVLDASPAAFETLALDAIAPSALEALSRAPAAVGPTGYASSTSSYASAGAPPVKLALAGSAGDPRVSGAGGRIAGPATARKPDLKPVPEMSVASVVSGDVTYQQVNVRAGQDAREASRLSIASTGSSLASPSGASNKAAPSFAPPSQFARSLSASTSSLSTGLPALREALRVPREGPLDVGQIGSLIVQALGGPACQAPLQNLNAGGGQNLGVWQLQVPPAAKQIIGYGVLIVKMVPAQSSHRSLDSEANNLCKLAEACPAIREDSKLTFPIKVLDIVPPSNRVQHNLMIMPIAKGKRLAEYMCMSAAGGRLQEMLGVIRDLGRELKLFHQRYSNRKHADFTPSNIFYDETTRSLTFIDVGGMGTQVVERDEEHFIKSLHLTMGPRSPYGQYLQSTVQAFQQGYMGR